MEKRKIILITGGAGFMGSNFVRFFLKSYPRCCVVNLDKLTYAGNRDNLKNVEQHPRYTFVKGDIVDSHLVSQLFLKYRFDTLFNFAAESHVDRSILGPRTFVQTDVLGVATLLDAAREYGVRRFIQVSTDEVYGEIQRWLFSENTPFQPRSPYSASKAGGDLLTHAYYTTYNVPVIRIHSCNFYGPYQYPEKFIPLFITNFLEGKNAPLYSTGEQVREWIYVDDFCRALNLVYQKGKAGEVYNIGTGHRFANNVVAKIIADSVGVPNTKIVQVKDRAGHDVRYALNTGKIRTLGFKPLVDFVSGLKETVTWYRNNRSWWMKIKKRKSFQEYYKRQYGEALN